MYIYVFCVCVSHLLLVRIDHLIPGAVAESGVLDRGRDAEGAVGRPDGTADEARLVRLELGHLQNGQATVNMYAYIYICICICMHIYI